jgi:hypothetical protein
MKYVVKVYSRGVWSERSFDIKDEAIAFFNEYKKEQVNVYLYEIKEILKSENY